MTSIGAAAKASRRRVSTADIVIAFGDNSSTGNSVQADIDHSEVMSLPFNSAPGANSSNGAENAASQPALRLGGPHHVGERGMAWPPRTR